MAEETEQPTAIFINNIDEYEANAVRTYLSAENVASNCLKYDLFATISSPENQFKFFYEQVPLNIISPNDDNFIPTILQCDMFLIFLNTPNFEKVCVVTRRILSALENWATEIRQTLDPEEEPTSRKYFILVSTPMTWALTQKPVWEKDDDDDPGDFILEEDYRRRRAHRKYCKEKLLERDVIWLQNRCKSIVRSAVVCPGAIYGAENDKFHYIFKLAFYNKIVPILKSGTQNIPTIYIKDFVKIIDDIINNFPSAKYRYIFAVQTKPITLKSLTYKICKSMNGDCTKIRFYNDVEMLMLDREVLGQNVLDVLHLDLNMVPTYFKDFTFQEQTDEFWDELVQEFREARNLRPLKIICDGPPLVGKTTHALKLCEYYQLLYIDTREVIVEYIKRLEEKINDGNIVIDLFECPETLNAEADESDPITKDKKSSYVLDEEDELLLTEVKLKVESWSKELLNYKIYLATHNTYEEQSLVQIMRCLISLISEKQYNVNQGYIIDYFPFTYEDAGKIFFKRRRNTSVDLDDHIDTPIPSDPLIPTHFIMMDACDELLCERAAGFTETEGMVRRCLRHQMLQRLDQYRERLEEPTCVANLFYDNDIIPIQVVINEQTEIMDTARYLREEIGPRYVYPLSREQHEALLKLCEEKKKQKEEIERRRQRDLETKIKLEREKKVLEWTAKYEEIRKQQNEMRQVKTLPIRQYLGKYVLPHLTEGILKVAELKPDDPVDFLAEYLFKLNPEGQQLPPYCTDTQRERFYSTFKDNISSTDDFFVPEEKFECHLCTDPKRIPKTPRPSE